MTGKRISILEVLARIGHGAIHDPRGKRRVGLKAAGFLRFDKKVDAPQDVPQAASHDVHSFPRPKP